MNLAQTSSTDEREQPWKLSLAVTLFAMMTLQMSSLGFSPLLPDIKKEFGISYSQLGLFTGLYGLVAIVSSIPAGLLAKRFGEKRVLTTGMGIVACGLFALSLASSFDLALGSRIGWLLGYRLAFVCVMTAVVITAPPSLRGVAMGMVGAIGAFASVIGAPFGSTIGAELGWRHAIVAYAGMAILGGLIFFAFYTRRDHGTVASSTGHPHAIPASTSTGNDPPVPAYKVPVVWALALLLGLCNAGGFSATFFVPSVMKEVFGSTATEGAYLISIAYVFTIFGNFFCGWLVDRFDRWWILGGAMLILVPSALAMMSTNLYVFMIATTLMIAIGSSVTNQVYGIAGTILTGRNTGPAIGIVSLGSGVFGYVGPQLLGSLRDWSGGFDAGWYAMAGAAALTFIEVLLLKRYSDRRKEKTNG